MTTSSDRQPGLLIVDKPGGMTSHDVVARVRRVLGTRKVGHAGTLDPMATGVLVIGVGRATRLLGHLSGADKAYDAVIRLGSSTDSDDADGAVVAHADPAAIAAVSDEAIAACLVPLTGAIRQVPSAVSAVKVGGRRAYDLVRSGEQVSLPARDVVVSRLECQRIERHVDRIDVRVAVECSSGTYVRALARDLGAALGIGGHLVLLRRTRVGSFGLEVAIPMDRIDGATELMPMGDAVRHAFPVRIVADAEADDVRHGRPIAWQGGEGVTALLDASGTLLALAEPRSGSARYLAVLADGS